MNLRAALLVLTTSSLIMLSGIPDLLARDVPPSNRPFYFDGTELQRRMELANRMTGPALTATEAIDSHAGMAFMTGVADAIQDISACPKGIERTIGIFSEVNKYMSSHPEQLSWSAAIIVRNALSSAYPCRVRD